MRVIRGARDAAERRRERVPIQRVDRTNGERGGIRGAERIGICISLSAGNGGPPGLPHRSESAGGMSSA